MPQLSQRLPWLILKEIAAFFLSFILYLNIFCKKLNHSMLWLKICYFIHCYNQPHSSDSPNSIYNWHVPSKWMGSSVSAINFSSFFDKQRKIITYITFYGNYRGAASFSLTWKTQPVIKSCVQEWCQNWKTRCVNCEEKRVKST